MSTPVGPFDMAQVRIYNYIALEQFTSTTGQELKYNIIDHIDSMSGKAATFDTWSKSLRGVEHIERANLLVK
eukprot:922377-Amphidinium_carterae.1